MNNKIKFTTILFLLLLFSGQAYTQQNYVKGANGYTIGGLGYLSLGYSFDVGKGLDQNLEKTFLLDTKFPSFGYNVGGGAYFLFARKFIVSGNGFKLSYQNTINKSNEMGFKGGGGGASVAYIVYDRYDWMIFPSIGVGGMSTKLNIRNTADSLIYFGDNEINIRTSQEFKLSQTYLDIGVSVHKLIQFNRGTNSKSGFSFGLSLGYIAGFGENSWQSADGRDVGDISPGKYNAFYVKLNLGGGWFQVRK